ncbi:hypothetical protein ADUPG1_011483 [Aduncisulcus paluster]|uniref:Uncharacterized protein n=1 Tax=Aduncisulcus paluster TaxID=2918883 RepID=A0ABQ5JZP2_9EUKA|nr:hypothetical protein ADUPG1_011483 [Aduncisulcus paluster]
MKAFVKNLHILSTQGKIPIDVQSVCPEEDLIELTSIAKSLVGRGFATLTYQNYFSYECTAEGKLICQGSSPEFKVILQVQESGESGICAKNVDKIGLGHALKRRWISRKNVESETFLYPVSSEVPEDIVKNYLLILEKCPTSSDVPSKELKT